MLEHQVNEQYQADFTARKQQLRRLLEPLAGPRPASRSKEDGSTAGQQQQQQQLDLGSPEVRAVLRRWLGQRGSLIALLEGLRRRYGTGGWCWGVGVLTEPGRGGGGKEHWLSHWWTSLERGTEVRCGGGRISTPQEQTQRHATATSTSLHSLKLQGMADGVA